MILHFPCENSKELTCHQTKLFIGLKSKFGDEDSNEIHENLQW